MFITIQSIYYYSTLPRQCDVVRLSKKSRSFIQNLRNKIIILFSKYFEKNPIVDVSHFPAKGYIELVDRRNAETLIPVKVAISTDENDCLNEKTNNSIKTIRCRVKQNKKCKKEK